MDALFAWLLNFGVVAGATVLGVLILGAVVKALLRRRNWSAIFFTRYERYLSDNEARREFVAFGEEVDLSAPANGSSWPYLTKPIKSYIAPQHLARPVERFDWHTVLFRIGYAVLGSICTVLLWLVMKEAPTLTISGRCATAFILALLSDPIRRLFRALALGARRHYSSSLAERRMRERRAPILYLRSFRHDGHLSLVQEGEHSTAVEEMVTSALSAVAPVIAIGSPGDRKPARGAARLYVREAYWQAVVTKFIKLANLVVLHVDDSAGLRWELEHLLREQPRKTILFLFVDELGFPFDSDRYTAFVKEIAGDFAIYLPIWAWNCYGVLLESDGHVRPYPAIISNEDIHSRGKFYLFHPFTSFQAFILIVKDAIISLLDKRDLSKQALSARIYWLWESCLPRTSMFWVAVHIVFPAALLSVEYFALYCRILFP